MIISYRDETVYPCSGLFLKDTVVKEGRICWCYRSQPINIPVVHKQNNAAIKTTHVFYQISIGARHRGENIARGFLHSFRLPLHCTWTRWLMMLLIAHGCTQEYLLLTLLLFPLRPYGASHSAAVCWPVQRTCTRPICQAVTFDFPFYLEDYSH